MSKWKKKISLLFDSVRAHPYAAAFISCFLFGITTFCSIDNITVLSYPLLFFFCAVIGLYIYKESGFEKRSGIISVGYSLVLFVVLSLILLTKQVVMLGTAVMVIGSGTILYLFFRKKLSAKHMIVIIMLIGIGVRIMKVLGASMVLRQHDVGYFSEDASQIMTVYEGTDPEMFTRHGGGHSGYIEYIFATGSLPDVDPTKVWSFYNPPLYHIISALWLRLAVLLAPDYTIATYSLKIVPLFCTIAIMILSYKLFTLMGLKKNGLVAACAIISFCPTFVIFSYQINNDPPSVALMLAALYFTLKWYRDPKIKYIIFAALGLGLGMMTKISVWTVAIPMATTFVYVFFRNIKQHKKIGKLILQYASFLFISVPLAFWCPLRNYLMYKMPFTYVQNVELIDDLQNIGPHEWYERLFDFSPSQFYPPWFNLKLKIGIDHNESNIFVAMFKTSVFSEEYSSKLTVSMIIGCILLFTAMILGVIGFIVMFAKLIREKKMRFENLMITAFMLAMLASFIYFCYGYPDACTQHIRYIPLTIIIGAMYIGSLYGPDDPKPLRINKTDVQEKQKLAARDIGIYALTALVFIYCVFSMQL